MVLAVRFFYIVGPAFAVWAVVLAIIGFRSPGFPGRAGGQRIVIAISVALMLAVILSATIGAKFEHTEHPKAEKPAAGG